MLPGELTTPTEDEVRLMKSGRIRISLQNDKRFFLNRPTVGQFQALLERYDDLRNEYYDFDAPPIKGATGRERPPVREGMKENEMGGRWLSEVFAELAPEVPPYDHLATPSWAVSVPTIFSRFTQHWMEVPLVSDADEPETTPIVIPEPTKPEPQLIKNVMLS